MLRAYRHFDVPVVFNEFTLERIDAAYAKEVDSLTTNHKKTPNPNFKEKMDTLKTYQKTARAFYFKQRDVVMKQYMIDKMLAEKDQLIQQMQAEIDALKHGHSSADPEKDKTIKAMQTEIQSMKCEVDRLTSNELQTGEHLDQLDAGLLQLETQANTLRHLLAARDTEPSIGNKRKHLDETDTTQLRLAIQEFITRFLKVSADTFTSTAEMQEVFQLHYAHVDISPMKFQKEMKQLIQTFMPTATPKQINRKMGYIGLAIADN